MCLPSGTYLILPKGSDPLSGEVLGIGPILAISPPPDVPVRLVRDSLKEYWWLRTNDNGTYNVFAGRGQSDDYKWIVKIIEQDGWPVIKRALYASSVSKPHDFKFEPAGSDQPPHDQPPHNQLYHIKIPDENLLLTVVRSEKHQLIFAPAGDSDASAQLFRVVPFTRD